MEKSREDSIFERAKESLEKLGMYSGETKYSDYNPNINSISKSTLEDIIKDCSRWGIGKIFKDLLTQHRRDIKDIKIKTNVSEISRGNQTCDPEKLTQTIEYLENEGLLNKNDIALSLMQYVYDSRIADDKAQFEERVRTLETSFFNNYTLHNPDMDKIFYQGTNLDAIRKYESAKQEFVKNWIIGHYGTSSPMHTSRNDFYSGELSENDFSFVIVDAILKEYGVDFDPEEVKKLFSERTQQLQEGNVRKPNITPLQKREAELSSLEAEAKTISEAEALINQQQGQQQE